MSVPKSMHVGDNVKPKYQHDCDECKFIGRLYMPDKDYDIWYHLRTGKDDNHVIARYSSDGPDYNSMDYKYAIVGQPGSVLFTAARMVDFNVATMCGD